jgi:hypothetical protein
MAVYDIVAGTTNVLQFQLIENGQAIDITGITVTLLLEDRTGTAVPSPGTVTTIDALNGKVQLTPTNAAVFTASAGPYYARWVLTTMTGLVSFVPSSQRDVWNIVGN